MLCYDGCRVMVSCYVCKDILSVSCSVYSNISLVKTTWEGAISNKCLTIGLFYEFSGIILNKVSLAGTNPSIV